MIIGMKLSKSKCWILNMGTELLLGTSTHWERSLGSALQGGPWGCWGQQQLSESQQGVP